MTKLTKMTLLKGALAAVAVTVAVPATTLAQDSLGVLPLRKEEGKKPKKKKKQDIVDVRQDASWKGPRTLREALAIVSENGTIKIHPGNYPSDALTIVKSVNIEGIPTNAGVSRGRARLPVLKGQDGGCVTVAHDTVQVRISGIAFRAYGDSCIKVSNGSLEMTDSAVYGSGFQPDVFVNPSRKPKGRDFSHTAVNNAEAALVTVTGGNVTLANNIIMGGENGVLVKTLNAASSFSSVEMRNNQITRAKLAGVLMDGTIDGVIENNTVALNAMSGIIIQGSGFAQLVGNTIAMNENQGLYVNTVDDYVTIEKNQIADNTKDGIYVESGSALLVDNTFRGHDKGCAVEANFTVSNRDKSKKKNPSYQDLATDLNFTNETVFLYKNVNTGTPFTEFDCGRRRRR